MVCPYCSGLTRVINSRPQKRSNSIWRRRKCLNCATTFTSVEMTDLRGVYRVENGDRLTELNPDILFTDILSSLPGRKNSYVEARELTNSVLGTLAAKSPLGTFKSSEISQQTALALKRFDKQAWHSYIGRHPSAV